MDESKQTAIERWLIKAGNDLRTARTMLSTDGGNRPIWGPEGRELFYRQGNKVIAVPIETGPAFETGKPEVLFEAPYVRRAFVSSYDVAPDGRFLMIKPSEEELEPPSIYVVLDWFEELKRRVPVD